MLSPEALQAISARLANASSDAEGAPAEETSAQQDVVEEPTPQTETPVVETKAPTESEPAKVEQRTVPLDEVVKLRKDRRVLREELDAVKAQLAKLSGFVAGRKSVKAEPGTDAWIDEVLSDTPDEQPEQEPEDPRDKTLAELRAELAEVKAWKSEQEKQEGRALLAQVLDACVKQDPTVPKQFVIDEIAIGRTPEQAMAKWTSYKAGLLPAQQPAVKPAPSSSPVAPPTVGKAPASPTSEKPRSWDDASRAARQAVLR